MKTKMRDPITKFDGEYEFLSNFYDTRVEYEGLTYPSSENAFQAAKTLNMSARKAFTLWNMYPGMAKHLGKALTLRSDWDNVRLQVMEDILASKFSHFVLKQKLLATEDAEPIEGNTWGDTFWGVCNGKGTNFLGVLLMDLRKKLTMPSA